MNKLKLAFVGGFLGSGKTTAIAQAALYFKAKHKRVGVITNDQGTQQVDSKMMESLGITYEEVADGCFCCNYSALTDRIEKLGIRSTPEIIFAESVGSCTDIAATVINPLLRLNPGRFDIVFSVFADVTLLTGYLKNQPSVFDENIDYIYRKQLEEADILVVNKIDLLSEIELHRVKQLINDVYPYKCVLFQHALSGDGLAEWFAEVDKDFHDSVLRKTPEIDYDRYADGEAGLGWLDEEIGIVSSERTAGEAALFFIRAVKTRIADHRFPIGHLKFFLDDGYVQAKISFTSAELEETDLPMMKSTERIVVLVNARVQADPAILQQILLDSILETESVMNCKIIENQLSAFRPGYPKPLHRIPG